MDHWVSPPFVGMPVVLIPDHSRAWTADYGCADEDGFDYLYAYSPLHNVNPKATYPSTMLLTAECVLLYLLHPLGGPD